MPLNGVNFHHGRFFPFYYHPQTHRTDSFDSCHVKEIEKENSK